jgi:filamentous hemagglutinin family protein
MKRTTFTGRAGIRVALMATTVFFASTVPSLAVDRLATPSGEVVTAGSATFDRPAAGQLNINQNTHRAVINWDNFNIGRDATTTFVQPNVNSLAVNRVVGAQTAPTQILGRLNANGKIMVLDRNGVLFGKNSRVDVGGIIASTGDVTDADVLDGGTMEITGADTGMIDMRGNISVADAGLAAFVAPSVRNTGVINAKLGRVSLAAGSQATVDLFGDDLISLAVDSELENALLHNRGAINAEAGNVQFTTAVAEDIVDNSINMDGVVDVSSVTQKAGKIVLAGASDTTVRGDLLAGDQGGGGDITIESDDISIGHNADIHADTTFTGVGGRVTLNAANGINSNGNISANGEEAGGRVILHGGDNVTVNGKVEARATGIGTGGRIDIAAGGDEARIGGRLNAGGIDGAGTIAVDSANILTLTERSRLTSDALSTGTGGAVRLTGEDIVMNGRIGVNGTEGGGRVVAEAGNNLDMNGNITGNGSVIGTGAVVRLDAGNDINMNGRISANGLTGGGRVVLNGNNVTMSADSRVSARGFDSGLPDFPTNPGGRVTVNAVESLNAAGRVDVTGFNGGGGIVRMAGTDVALDEESRIRADGGSDGDGGRVLLEGVNNTDFNGRITARGGSVAGDGGTVRFNTPNTIGASGNVDVSAANGTEGTFVH